MGINNHDNPMQDIRIGEVTAKWAESNHLYVHYAKSMDSTNDLAKTHAFSEEAVQEALCVYLTDQQTKGRGRGQNTWTQESPGGALISSWSYLTNAKPQPTLPCLVGLALYRACSTTWPFLAWGLKAPNDLYIGGHKVAGLLIENIVQADETRIIVGLGLNAFTSPQQIANSTSVAESLPSGVPLLGQDWIAFLDRLLFEMTDAISHCDEALSPSDQHSLLMALNSLPLLEEPYTHVEADGSLLTANKKILWSEL